MAKPVTDRPVLPPHQDVQEPRRTQRLVASQKVGYRLARLV
ncbi:MAG TPA: hypothetical protein VN792_05985 [Candidatus Acidoferrales bacterium]|nr:hypothetical protein [Candidatus Acidoferrales bacterium]